MLVYPAWHPGKEHYELIAKKDVFLCATYHKGMEMHGYRPHILEYKENCMLSERKETDRHGNAESEQDHGYNG